MCIFERTSILLQIVEISFFFYITHVRVRFFDLLDLRTMSNVRICLLHVSLIIFSREVTFSHWFMILSIIWRFSRGLLACNFLKDFFISIIYLILKMTNGVSSSFKRKVTKIYENPRFFPNLCFPTYTHLELFKRTSNSVSIKTPVTMCSTNRKYW